jgi:glycerophosphoryl diester phosphodiesterase
MPRSLRAPTRAHDAGAIATTRAADLPALPSLADAADVVRGRAYLNVDLKVSGCERELADALRAMRATGHALVSTLDRASARRLKEADADLAVSLSYPRDRAVRARALLRGSTALAAHVMRATLPLRLRAWLDESRADALTLWHGVIDARVVRAAAVPVIGWTVNDARTAHTLRDAGVRGITTDDPRAVAAVLRAH